VPPAEVQLYYQTLLIGRKELSWAPDRRMGIEMTLLRALAFHPRKPLPEPEQPRQAPSLPVINPVPVRQQMAQTPQPRPDETALPDTTSQVLQARTQLMRQQGANKAKKSEPAAPNLARPAKNTTALERLASVSERIQSRPAALAEEKPEPKPEAYRWKSQIVSDVVEEPVATPKALKRAMEHEKTPELAQKLAVEAIERDSWSAEISQLVLPKLVQQLALNAWKEQDGNRVCLHLRPALRHLNSPSAQKTLVDALSTFSGETVELTIIEDDNLAQRTPLEWRQAIYEEKLANARESMRTDNNIQTLRRFFDAELDEDSIRPI
jgi:DNA polymerase-3 subunit gamma/tau